MAEAHITMTVDVKNMDRVKLLAWELQALCDEMRVMASPHADRFEAILDRFFAGDEDGDRPEDDNLGGRS